MKADPSRRQTVRDRLKAFQCARIYGIHGWTHKNNVFQCGLVGDVIIDRIFQRAGIGEIQAFVHTDRQDRVVRDDLMAVHVAEMLGPRHLTHDGHVRARGAPQE